MFWNEPAHLFAMLVIIVDNCSREVKTDSQMRSKIMREVKVSFFFKFKQPIINKTKSLAGSTLICLQDIIETLR